MDAGEAHDKLMTATGGLPRPGQIPDQPAREHPPHLLPVTSNDLNGVASALGAATTELERFAAAVRKLVEIAEEVVDDDGREIWLTAGEVEMDQWTQRLTDAAAVVRRQLGSTS